MPGWGKYASLVRIAALPGQLILIGAFDRIQTGPAQLGPTQKSRKELYRDLKALAGKTKRYKSCGIYGTPVTTPFVPARFGGHSGLPRGSRIFESPGRNQRQPMSPAVRIATETSPKGQQSCVPSWALPEDGTGSAGGSKNLFIICTAYICLMFVIYFVILREDPRMLGKPELHAFNRTAQIHTRGQLQKLVSQRVVHLVTDKWGQHCWGRCKSNEF